MMTATKTNVKKKAATARTKTHRKVMEFADALASYYENDLLSAIEKAFEGREIDVVATPDEASISISKLKELREAGKVAQHDNLFLDLVIDKSEILLELAERQKAKGEEDDATEVAKKMIPVLEKHVKKAKELKKLLTDDVVPAE
jgi:hypothetical protein